MSTRYVWEQYSFAYEETRTEKETFLGQPYSGNLDNTTLTGYAAAGYRDTGNGTYDLVPPLQPVYYSGSSRRAPTSSYPYFGLEKTGNAKLCYEPYPADNKYWYGTYHVGRQELGVYEVKGDGTSTDFIVKGHKTIPGSLIGHRSSGSGTAYPEDGPSDDKWYKKLGADSIDPVSVAYSASQLKPGDQVVVTITPAAPQLGGTVHYQYGVRTSAALVWNAWGPKTAELSKTYTIPSSAKYFSVRATAGDDWGFTSTTAVAGPTIPVTQPEQPPEPGESGGIYVGVNEKARQLVKIYVGVNNVAREVKAGYIGVNNTARKFL